MNRFDIVKAIEDRKIFGSLFQDQSSWTNWKAALKTVFGLIMTKEEMKIYRKFTDRAQYSA